MNPVEKMRREQLAKKSREQTEGTSGAITSEEVVEKPNIIDGTQVAPSSVATATPTFAPKVLPKNSDLDDSQSDTITTEDTPAGTQTITSEAVEIPDMSEYKIRPKKVKTTKPTRDVKAENNKDVTFLRDFPRSIVNLAKATFPDARNQTDAVVAYLIVKSGETISDVSEEVQALVEAHEYKNPLISVEEQLSTLTRLVNKSISLSEESHVATSYMLLDRLGFRQENPIRPEAVNFSEDGLLPLRQRLSIQTRQIKDVEARKSGRPIRGRSLYDK